MPPKKRFITCEICGYRSSRKSSEKRTFMAKFPLDEDRCRQWVKVVGKEDLVYVPIEKLHTLKYVCGSHFENNDFNQKQTRLNRSAVPSKNLKADPLPDDMLTEFPCYIYDSESSLSQVDGITGSCNTEPPTSCLELLDHDYYARKRKALRKRKKAPEKKAVNYGQSIASQTNPGLHQNSRMDSINSIRCYAANIFKAHALLRRRCSEQLYPVCNAIKVKQFVMCQINLTYLNLFPVHPEFRKGKTICNVPDQPDIFEPVSSRSRIQEEKYAVKSDVENDLGDVHNDFEDEQATSSLIETPAPLVYKRKYSPGTPICRACLTTRRKLYSIQDSDVLDAYQSLSGTEVSEDDRLPNWLCSHCIISLRKCKRFIQSCKEAVKELSEALSTGYIVDARKFENCRYERTEVTNIDIVEAENVELTEKPDEEVVFNDADEIVNEEVVEDVENKDPDLLLFDKKIFRSNQTLRILSDPIKLEEFQNLYHVDAHKLSHEEKMQDVLDRRDRTNYLNSPFKCDMCFKGFMAEDFLYNHIRRAHSESNPEMCEFCKNKYRTQRELALHYIQQHTVKMSCRLCPRITRTIVEAKKHFIEFHQRKLSTTCEYCGLEFCSTPKYLQHVNDVHPNELIWCNMCGHLFIREVSLEKHKKRRHRNLHLSASCPHCEVQLVDGAALDNHLFPGICSRYTCVHCGAGHSDAMRLRNHILKAHNKRNVTRFTCPKCNKVYKQGAHLQNHLKYVHYKVNRKVVCEICGVVVATNASLKVHMRHHTGERPYQCPVCMKGFMSQTSMMRHRNTVHTTLRPFVCERCPKAFKKKDSLLSHEQKVHDIRTAPPGELASLGVLI